MVWWLVIQVAWCRTLHKVDIPKEKSDYHGINIALGIIARVFEKAVYNTLALLNLLIVKVEIALVFC